MRSPALALPLRASLLLAAFAALALLSGDAAASPVRHYVVVTGIEESPGAESGVRDEIGRLFAAELARRAELVVPGPTDPALPTEPGAMRAELARRKLKAVELTLRILEVTRGLEPPPTGKQYRVLKRSVRLSVFGNTLPERVMALGGEGDSSLGVEVGAHDDLEAQGRAVLLDCAKEAIRQAVDMTVVKLTTVEKPAKARRKKQR